MNGLKNKRLNQIILCFGIFALLIAWSPVSLSKEPNIPKTDLNVRQLQKKLQQFASTKKARIGIAVIINGKDTVAVNGNESFPMLSAYKFPQALAVADYCNRNGLSFNDSINIPAEAIEENTWSPMRDQYGKRQLFLSISELLSFSLQQSDNNACDILFRLIGGPEYADSVMDKMGYRDINVLSTESEMHSDINLCYDNSATPLSFARLMEKFNTELRYQSPECMMISQMIESCSTGIDRLPKPLLRTGAVIGHKTGTGDVNSRGEIIAVNDAGYVNLPDKSHYSITVFIANSTYQMNETAQIIAEISQIVFESIADSASKK